MLRKLFVTLFILTSLTAQAGNAFACEMMGQVVMDRCCCTGEEMMSAARPGTDGAPCCEQITVIGEQLDAAGAKAKLASPLPLPDLQPQTLAPAPAAMLALSSPPRTRVTYAPPRSWSRSGTLTYLHTQRLRI